MASSIIADSPDQEGHRCTGVKLLKAYTFQQPPAPPFSTRFNTTRTTGTLLTLVPYFIGTRSAVWSGLLFSGCFPLSLSPFFSPLPYTLTFTATFI